MSRRSKKPRTPSPQQLVVTLGLVALGTVALFAVVQVFGLSRTEGQVALGVYVLIAVFIAVPYFQNHGRGGRTR